MKKYFIEFIGMVGCSRDLVQLTISADSEQEAIQKARKHYPYILSDIGVEEMN